MKRDKNSISKSKTIGNSILDHGDFISHLDDDEISNKSYGSHTYRFNKDESHKGSADMLDEQEEKRDASKEELGIAEGKVVSKIKRCVGLDRFAPSETEEEGCECKEALNEDLVDANTEDIIEEYSADCCPESCYKQFPFLAGDEDSPFWQGWANLRYKTFRLIENKYFETAVITMILLSSFALALEDVHLSKRPILQDILYYMDRIFTVIFFFEMLIKWLALGFQKYFTNAWCWLDFIIVMVSHSRISQEMNKTTCAFPAGVTD
jgi:voltage-gated sodium channel type II alpha